MTQNTASKGSEISKDQLSTPIAAPLLSPDKEAILKELTYIDIHGDRQAESESDKKMLAWTLNEIRKTCGKLPVEKLRFLIESIKKVMVEKTVYQGSLERELKKQRDILKQEVEDEQRVKPKVEEKKGLKDSIIQFFQDNTDFRLLAKSKLENINEMTPKDRAEFERKMEQDEDLMSKFMQGYSNDTRWRKNLKAKHGESLAILDGIYNRFISTYKLKIEEGETLTVVREKIALAKKADKDKSFNSTKASILANSISQTYLIPLDASIQKIIFEDVKNKSPLTFYNIASIYSSAWAMAIKIRQSPQYQEFLLMAEKSKDPEILNKVKIFSEKLAELDALSREYDSLLKVKWLLTTENQVNVLSKLRSKIKSLDQGILKGERTIEYYNKIDGNTSKSISEFEIDIKKQIDIGWPANVNPKGLSQYLQALRINGNLNHEYLKNTGILTQFWLYWKLANGSTKSQDILGKEDPLALEQFKEVIKTHLAYTFSKEKINNRTAFEGLDTYLTKLNTPKEEIESITSALKKSQSGGTVELTALASLLKSKNVNIKEIAELALSGYEHFTTVAEVEAGKMTWWSINHMLSKLNTANFHGWIGEDMKELMNDPKKTEKEFNWDTKMNDMYKTPKSRDKFLKILEIYISKTDTSKHDKTILTNIKNVIIATQRSQTMETVKSNKHVQIWMVKAAAKIQTKTDFSKTLEAAESNAAVKKFVENVNQAVIFDQNAKREIQEQSVDFNEATIQKIISLLGLDPEEFSKEKLKNSPALRDVMLNRIGWNLEWLETQLTADEIKQLRILQSNTVSHMRADLLTRQQFGTINTYQSDMRTELRTSHPALAAQREALEINNYDLSSSIYKDLNTQKNYVSSSNINIESIQSMPAGTPFQLDNNTIFTLSNNGSCSIITPYSIQIIPPEKTNIALWYISAAKIFPGLDFMGGLHETLQSYSKSPILAKMKDWVSDREQCNLVKHYATILGVEGYNELADTPDALIQSIKNSIPIGTSFWELAKKRGLLKPDGTLNPIAFWKTFDVPNSSDTSKWELVITKKEKMSVSV